MRRIAAHLITASLALAARAEAIDPRDRLHIAGLQLGSDMAVRYERETTRLLGLCQDPKDLRACLERYVDRTPWRVAAVYRAPDPTSPMVGFVDAVFRANDGGLELALEFAPASDSARRTVWLAADGKVWDFGLVDQPGVRTHGTWIELIGAPFPEAGWLDGSAAGFDVRVSSIAGTAVVLPALSASFPDGDRRAIEPGAYLIERIADGVIFFRQQVATDFPCDEGEKPPPVMPPTLRANAPEFFGADGKPLFSSAYTGCC